jgi:hypothetical protein
MKLKTKLHSAAVWLGGTHRHTTGWKILSVDLHINKKILSEILIKLFFYISRYVSTDAVLVWLTISQKYTMYFKLVIVLCVIYFGRSEIFKGGFPVGKSDFNFDSDRYTLLLSYIYALVEFKLILFECQKRECRIFW